MNRSSFEQRETVPPWRLIETFSRSKDPRKETEDGILASEHCFAVLDGVSSRDSDVSLEGMSPGRFAVQIGIEALKDYQDFDNPQNIVPHVTRRLQEALLAHNNTTDASFVFVAFFPKLNMIVRVGDCLYLVDGVGANEGLKVDRAKSLIRAHHLQKLKAGGATTEELTKADPTRPRMRELTKQWQPHFVNESSTPEFGYGLLNGDPVPEALIEYISVPKGARTIVLATDGYPPEALQETLEGTEQELARLLKDDPLGIEQWLSTRGVQPGMESFDDRAYVRIAK